MGVCSELGVSCISACCKLVEKLVANLLAMLVAKLIVCTVMRRLHHQLVWLHQCMLLWGLKARWSVVHIFIHLHNFAPFPSVVLVAALISMFIFPNRVFICLFVLLISFLLCLSFLIWFYW